MKSNTLIQKKYTLTCLSPVHIGNGEVLKAFEYLYDREKQLVYFLNETKWIALLEKYQLMNAFSNYLLKISSQKQNQGNNIWEWLLTQRIPLDEIRGLSIRSAKANPKVLMDNRKKGTLNDIVCQIALADGRPYIPGSSIKGAMRTAILAQILEKDEILRTKYWNRIIDANTRMKNDIKSRGLKKMYNLIIKDLESEILEKLNNPMADDKKKRVSNQAKNMMRGLMVGDAIGNIDRKTIICQKIDISTNENYMPEKHLPLFRECIPASSSLDFQLTIDKAMLEKLGITHPDQLIQLSHKFIQKGISLQEDTFGNSYTEEFALAKEADFILGGGTGFLTKSLLYILAPTTAEGKRIVANYLNKEFPKHKHDSLDKIIAPRTLKVTHDNQGRSILGLCRIEGVAC